MAGRRIYIRPPKQTPTPEPESVESSDFDEGVEPTPRFRPSSSKVPESLGKTSFRAHIERPDEDTWQEWINKLERAMDWIGVAAYQAQVMAAERVADVLRNYLASGVSPELSTATMGIIGGYRPPLAALARHVIVKKHGRVRARQARTTGGRFASGFHPCEITFEDAYQEVAFDLNYGLIYVPTPEQRRAVQAAIMSGGGSTPSKTESGASRHDTWELPARPFLHVLTDPGNERMVKRLVSGVLSGKVSKRDTRWLGAHKVSKTMPQHLNVDELEGVVDLATPQDYGIEDMIDMSRSGKTPWD